ncbi:class C sortase [Halalkalibacillus sediminis]|uniref:Class C sortase n=1 Tax=Halalkalibacillus sediminis TaxID=2018042 RepID=A0A2I0QU73_9BACI|nr:class C sortase [Halalkalibacillus sediminis]PKR77905.1 class C sortase [Halalkalibacillus sediminis]
MKFKMVLSLIFIIGLGVFFYPIIGNWLATQSHYEIIENDEKVIESLDENIINEERIQAEEYNREVGSLSDPILDPFAEDYEEENYQSYFSVLNLGESMGSLEIPEIDVKLPIYHGASDEVLQRGVGHLSNTSLPVGGEGNHSVLTGHRGLPSAKLFRELDELEMEDKFFIKTLGETLAYQIDDIQIVEPHEVDWLIYEKDQDYVTLITCDPYMLNTHRLLVRGHRIPHDPMVNDEEWVMEAPEGLSQIEEENDYFWYVMGGTFVVGSVGSVYFYRRRIRKNVGE